MKHLSVIIVPPDHSGHLNIISDSKITYFDHITWRWKDIVLENGFVKVSQQPFACNNLKSKEILNDLIINNGYYIILLRNNEKFGLVYSEKVFRVKE